MTTEAALVEADCQPDGIHDAAAPAVAPCISGASAELGLAFRTDQPGAFTQVVQVHEQRITRLAHRVLGWRGGSDVQDIVQDVFLAAFKHRHRFRGNANLGTWLAAIAVNRCRSHQRRQRLRQRLAQLLFRRDNRELEASCQAPATVEQSARVRLAVQALPPRDREVVVLRYFESMSAAEIASVTRQSKNAVEVRLHRARARLAEVLGDWYREESP